jgi:hypothetical protein
MAATSYMEDAEPFAFLALEDVVRFQREVGLLHAHVARAGHQ